jgi:hypothetical protein
MGILQKRFVKRSKAKKERSREGKIWVVLNEKET